LIGQSIALDTALTSLWFPAKEKQRATAVYRDDGDAA
jgi:hypothetical protein